MWSNCNVVNRGIVAVAVLSTAAAYADPGDQLAKLLPNDGAEFDRFGVSVAISGATAIVGARFDDDNGASSGSAYLFDTTTGEELFKLLPNDGAASDQFGVSVAISGAAAVVGAAGDDDNGSSSGSAYLFDITTGQQVAKLLPNDGAAGDHFGNSVAISGATAIVGAWGDDDNGGNSGSAYLFDTRTGRQIAKLLPDDGAAADWFGLRVAISGATAIIGAPPWTTTTAPNPAPPTSSTPPRAPRSPSSSPTTARRSTSSASPLRSAAPPPSSGPGRTTTTATCLAPPTSLMLLPLLFAPGTSMLMARWASSICLRSSPRGAATPAVRRTSTAMATSAFSICSPCSPTGSRARINHEEDEL